MEVVSYFQNSFGFYDMHGNVWKWCNDRSGDYLTREVTDLKGSGKGEDRELQGAWVFRLRCFRNSFLLPGCQITYLSGWQRALIYFFAISKGFRSALFRHLRLRLRNADSAASTNSLL